MKAKKKTIDPRRLFVVHLMATINKTGLLMEKMKKNGQNILRREIFGINRWQLISDIQIGH